MKKTIYLSFLMITLAICVSAFRSGRGQWLHSGADTLMLKIPANFPKPVHAVEVSEKGFELGKALFYDPSLSVDGTISCSSCHQQSAAFANLGSALSTGINQCRGARNAPPLINLAWQKEFMWDGRISEMELVPTNALTSPCEMGNQVPEILKTLNNNPIYRDRFKAVFGDRPVTEKDLLNVLSQFTVMLISAQSKYDHVMRHEYNAAFTVDEQSGYDLFRQKCSSCHTEPLFTDGSYRNNGLDETYTDIGRDSLTRLKADLSKFRVPTLRNIEISGPYMHDGRFRSLKQVLIHYSSGMKNHHNLDPLFKRNGKIGIPLTEDEQFRLIAFLKTLTDVDFINDRHFNNN